MTNLLKIKASFLSLMLVVLPVFFFTPTSYAAEIPGKTLRIVLGQARLSLFDIISTTIEHNNPERYMKVYTDNYIVVKELDASGAILYEGQVKQTKLDAPGFLIELPEDPLIINFPYFDNATAIHIVDSSGKQILSIDLAHYSILPTPTALPRSIECNACGYCKDKKSPGNLDACMKCLYPNMTIEQTLAENPPLYLAPQPKSGAYYTQLGCIDVGIAGFTDSSASGGVLNVILNRLLFPITGVLALLSIIYGAFLVMTAQGNAEQVARGRKWIIGAIVGVVFTYGSLLLIRIIGGDVLKIPGLGG